MKITKHPTNKESFQVESSKGGLFYDVDPNKPSCTCPSYKFRESKKGGVCKHIVAVREELQKLNSSLFDKIKLYVKEKQEVDSMELIDEFGDEAIDQLITQGELIETKGLIRLME